MDVKSTVYGFIAEAFKVDEETLTDSMTLLGDLKGSSVNYIPLINELGDEYDLDIQYQQFRRECPTVGDVVAYIEDQI